MTTDSGRIRLATMTVRSESDVFVLRHRGRTVCAAAGLENQDQVRVATALSEIGRELMGSSLPAAVDFSASGSHPPTLVVTVRWRGSGGGPQAALTAASRLMDRVTYAPEGVCRSVVMEKQLPPAGPAPRDLVGRVRAALDALPEHTTLEELRSHNRDLLAALDEAQTHREELRRLNVELEETNRGVMALYHQLSQELEETNRGVVALYAELDEKSRQLRNASEAKTRFWANVSHELRTPVNAVVGLARLLLDPGSEPLSAEQRRQIRLVADSGSTLLALVDELLDVAKAESGRMEPQPAPVDLRALLAQLRGTMRPAAQTDEVTLSVPDPVGLPELVTDEVMLLRILRNLLSNGLKFTTAGRVSLRVAAEADWFVFTVEDTGAGIPAEHRERVFEEFYQVHGAHQRGTSGTGLGLPYARRLAELLGGSLTLDSEVGRGTRVTVRLPAGRRGEDTPAGGPPARLGTVLLVDDDAAFRTAFRPVLEQLADRVTEAPDGVAALAALATPVDAVFADLRMAGVDGYQLVEHLAGHPELSGVPVVVVTATDPAHLDRDRLVHATAVLEKTGLTAGRLRAALRGRAATADVSDVPDGPDGPSGGGEGTTAARARTEEGETR